MNELPAYRTWPLKRSGLRRQLKLFIGAQPIFPVLITSAITGGRFQAMMSKAAEE
jgi:hypothetical protein